MPDISHFWSGDISAAANGDLLTVDGINLGIQRVLRRLMTAQGEYIWHPTYGAGLPQRVGQTRDDRVISAIIRSQIYLEPCVAKTPVPVITIVPILNGISVTIQYTDVNAQKRVTVTFPISARPFSQSQQADISIEVPT